MFGGSNTRCSGGTSGAADKRYNAWDEGCSGWRERLEVCTWHSIGLAEWEESCEKKGVQGSAERQGVGGGGGEVKRTERAAKGLCWEMM